MMHLKILLAAMLSWLFIGTTIAQTSDATAILQVVNDKIRSVEKGVYDVTYWFKPALSEDTSHQQGRVFFFKDRFGQDSLGQFVLYIEDKLVNAYDGENFYDIHASTKTVRVQDTKRNKIQHLINGNGTLSNLLFLPFLSITPTPFETHRYDSVSLCAYQHPDYPALQIIRTESAPNDLKMAPTDPENISFRLYLDFSIPDFSLRSLTDWFTFTSTPQYHKIAFSAITPLAANATFKQQFNLDSLLLSGYQLQETDLSKKEEPDNLIREGTVLPDALLPNLDQKLVDVKRLGGKIILLDFWYRSCAPCLKALPAIKNLHHKYGKSGLTVLGVNPIDKDPAIVRSFLAEREVPYPCLMDQGGAFSQKLGIRGYPVLILMDAKTKKVILAKQGYYANLESDLSKILEKRLKK